MVFEKCSAIIADMLGISVDDVKLDSDIVNGLGADSLDVIQMLNAMEEEYGFSFTDDEIVSIKTVGDVVALIEKRVK